MEQRCCWVLVVAIICQGTESSDSLVAKTNWGYVLGHDGSIGAWRLRN